MFDKSVAEESCYTFSLVNRRGWVAFQVSIDGGTRVLTPEEVIAILFVRLKEACQVYLGSEVRDVVIGVPVAYYDSQRRATLDAARMAGFRVVGVINVPASIALAYHQTEGVEYPRTLMTLNIGGGETDVSVVQMFPSSFRVIASGGNSESGGDDIDARMIDGIVDEFISVNGVDLRYNKTAIQCLRLAIKAWKRSWRWSENNELNTTFIVSGYNLSYTIGREQFARASSQVAKEMSRIVQATKERAFALGISDIDRVIFNGGTCRNPYVLRVLSEVANCPIDDSLINTEPVAEGTAYYAALLGGVANLDHPVDYFSDVTDRTFGVVSSVGWQDVISAQSTVPISKTIRLKKLYSGSSLEVFVYERDKLVAADYHPVGVYQIGPLSQGMEIDVRLSIDRFFIFHLTVDNPLVSVAQYNGRITEEEIGKLAEEIQFNHTVVTS